MNALDEASEDALAVHLNSHYHAVLKEQIEPHVEKGSHPTLYEWGYSNYLRDRSSQNFDTLYELTSSWLLEHQLNNLDKIAEKESKILGRGGSITGDGGGKPAASAAKAKAKADAKKAKKEKKRKSLRRLLRPRPAQFPSRTSKR